MATGTLLVWDAPNMDMTLGTVVNAKPTAEQRPRFDAIGRWLVDQAADRSEVEATVFTNIATGSAAFVRPWIEAVRSAGYAVFAKPKHDDSDVDQEMLDLIAERHRQDWLGHVVVASADGRNFREPLEALVADGVRVTVLSFAEQAGFATASELIDFIDLEDVPHAFSSPLGRLRLDALPPEGIWLAPTRPLGG